MDDERRKYGRHSAEKQLDEKLSLYLDGHAVGIVQVRDISPFGIGLMIDGYIACGRELSLRYRHENVDIEVHGAVNWSAAAQPGYDKKTDVWLIGIFISDDEVIAGVELFNVITA